MATIGQLENGLRKAHAAGNADHARAFANEIRRMRQAPKADFSGVTTSAETVSRAEPPSMLDRAGRELGLGVRATLGGIASTAGIVTDPLASMAGLPSAREGADALSDTIGLPTPQTATERVGGDITSALAGGGGLIGLGRGLATRAPGAVSGVGNMLASMPGTQLASAAAGSGAAGTTREAGGSQGAQLAAGLIGGLGTPAVRAGVPAAIRGAVRGGEGSIDPATGLATGGRKLMQQNIRDFNATGASPSVGQAAQNWRTQGLESLLAGGPTSSGVMARAAERQAESIGSGLQRLADDFVPNASAERAGRAVERGVRGEQGFIQSSRKVADGLYRKLDDAIPAGSRVQVQNTRTALADLNTMIDGAPSVSRFFQNARLEGIERGLLSDVDGIDAILTQPGMREQVEGYRAYLKGQQAQAAQRNANRQALNQSNLERVPTDKEIEANVTSTLGNMVDSSLPYEALQKLRTLVGNEIENVSLASDVPRSKWKSLYGALSRDMEAAATTPEAKQALRRANNYYNARIDRIDAIDKVISRNGGPEKVFNAVMSGTRDGGTTLRAVMQSLPKEGQRAVTAAVIKRMGLASPGAQDAAGEAFSANTFLTNWNKASPEAKRALFDRHGPKFVESMNKIARVADNIKGGSQVFANPSGTANKGAAYAYFGSLPATAFFGGPGALTLQIMGGIGANGAARLMNNPAFVSWLASATRMPVSAVPQQAVILKGIASQQGDDELMQVAEALEQQHPNQPANAGNRSAEGQ